MPAADQTTSQIKETEIKELINLQNQSAADTPKDIKVSEGVTVTPLTALTTDEKELELLKKSVGDETQGTNAVIPPTEKTFVGKIAQGDEDGTGLELFIFNDGNTIPILFLIEGKGHEVGEKLTVTGVFDGALKFDGAYYPVLKSKSPVTAGGATEDNPMAAGDPVLGQDSAQPVLNGFQLSNILFAIFITASLAIVALRIKKHLDEKKAKPTRRKK